jgi:hypothetical protein
VTSLAVLDAAWAAGVVIEAVGDDLALEAPRAPPAELLAAIRAEKSAILAYLRGIGGGEAQTAGRGLTGELGEPLYPCPECGEGRWWRISAGEAGWTGRWHCGVCQPQPISQWCDAALLAGPVSVVPDAARRRPTDRKHR